MRELAIRMMIRMLGSYEAAGPAKRRLGATFMKYGPGQLTCREFEDFVCDYLDGNLTPRQQRTFELHMRLCAMCRAYVAAYRRAVELGQTVFARDDAALPADVPEDLVHAILAARAEE